MSRVPADWTTKVRRAGFAALLVAGVSFTTFTAANPTMWHAPLGESVRALRARAEVMRAQSRLPDQRRLQERPDRALIVPKRVFADYALVPLRAAGPILFVAGAAAAVTGLFAWCVRRHQNHALASLVTIGAAVSLPVLHTPLDWPRYYMLPVVFSGMATAAGLVWTAGRVRRHLRHRDA